MKQEIIDKLPPDVKKEFMNFVIDPQGFIVINNPFKDFSFDPFAEYFVNVKGKSRGLEHMKLACIDELFPIK